MCTPLAKLAIGLSATMATAFYYLAAAPPASAQVDVCGPGNYSTACAPTPASTPTEPDPQLATQPSLSQIYRTPPSRNATSIPEPGTAIAVLLTGAGMICSCRKRNNQVGPQR
ncbi:PEP-CTERM sorting domain-containing protein [Microcoleus sp. HI-ES]|uniref:PEP-CTERM sorting domain-containing protein n=1 Tax=Microcoleus sp. N9_B4 TaxID=3055386 RepID=UPI0022C3C937|nr:PEP-CTERM sorting domain-containing protein [Microcoleus sp. HI-ES]